MKAVRYVTVLAAALVLTANPATAQTSIGGTAVFDYGTTEVVYAPFLVSAPGLFTMETFNNVNTDPYIRLFENVATDGSGLGTQLDLDDDGAAGLNSRIDYFLGNGGYTLAMSVYHFAETEARSGLNSDTYGCVEDADATPAPGDRECSYSWSITSADGIAESAVVDSVPEPAAVLLLASGLLGVGVVVRRRSRAES